MRISRPSEGVCVTCGRVLDDSDRHTQCLDCRIAQKEREEAKKERRLNPNFHVNEKLDQDAKEACEHGLSYGRWRMMQEMKKRGEGKWEE